MITRLQFLRRAAGLVLGTGTLTGLYAWRVEPHWLEIVRRPLRIPNLPDSLVGRTLAQVSDIHVGRVDEDYLVSTLSRLAGLAPDIIMLTGDYVSWNTARRYDLLSRVVAHLRPAPIATLGVLGNHDYGPNWEHLDIAAEVTGRMEAAGVRMLRNETADIAGLRVIGLDDFWGPRFGPSGLFAAHEPGSPSIALCHNPDACDAHVWGRYDGWILSGHTHGGQVKPPFLPPPILPVQNKRYTAGEFGLTGGRRLYINKGVGHLLRVRFNVRPEVTLFTLERVTTEPTG